MKVDCKHPDKIVTDTYNMDGQVYYNCSDCGRGWRQKPETKEDRQRADEILEIDKKALNIK